MQICLHLGAHRTATTSFQAYLNQNREQLGRGGIEFWGPRRTRNGFFAGLTSDPSSETVEEAAQTQQTLARLKAELAETEESGLQQLLITEENLLGTMRENLALLQLYPSARAKLERIKPVLEPYALRIGLSIRSYELHWASQLAYRLMRGTKLPGEDALDKLATQPRRWRDIIGDILSVFDKAELIVMPFESTASDQQLVLKNVLALPPRDAAASHRDRHAQSADARRLERLMRERGDFDAAEVLSQAEGRYMPFDELHCEKLRQDYHEDINWLLACDDKRVTYVDLTTSRPERQKTISPERVQRGSEDVEANPRLEGTG